MTASSRGASSSAVTSSIQAARPSAPGVIARAPPLGGGETARDTSRLASRREYHRAKRMRALGTRPRASAELAFAHGRGVDHDVHRDALAHALRDGAEVLEPGEAVLERRVVLR